MVFIRHTVTDHTPYAPRTSYKYLSDRTASINDINQSEFELGTQSPGDELVTRVESKQKVLRVGGPATSAASEKYNLHQKREKNPLPWQFMFASQ